MTLPLRRTIAVTVALLVAAVVALRARPATVEVDPPGRAAVEGEVVEVVDERVVVIAAGQDGARLVVFTRARLDVQVRDGVVAVGELTALAEDSPELAAAAPAARERLREFEGMTVLRHADVERRLRH